MYVVDAKPMHCHWVVYFIAIIIMGMDTVWLWRECRQS